MSDFLHLPNAANGAETLVYSALGLNDWQTWTKPRGKSMLSITCVAPGGGGGGGFSGAASSARGGGGGGGSGGIARLVIPTLNLPDTLYLNIGLGGSGGAAGAAGAAGGNCFASITPSSTINDLLLTAAATVAGGGAAGSGTAGGAVGTSAVAGTAGPVAGLGTFVLNAGLVGLAGGAQTGAAGGTALFANSNPALPLCGGAGGAGVTATDFAGGGCTPPSWMAASLGGVAVGGRGGDGVINQRPLGFMGGGGGGSNNAAVGGAGGNAAIGCGGGGGGGGVTGGAGGNGGNGLIIITCW